MSHRFISVSILAALASMGSAQQAKVAIVAAASSSSTALQFTDPQSKLIGTGRFSQVDIINAATSTPSLLDLQNYDAVIVWSNVNFSNAALLGDTLADYVDAGGGVVLAVFANSTTTVGRSLTGRWLTGTYNIMPPALGNTSGASSLGTIHELGNPMAQGVNTLTATVASRPTTSIINPGCFKVGSWADGKTLMATGTTQTRCDIGMYPPSSDASASWWSSATDGAKVLANALLYAASDRLSPAAVNVTEGQWFGGNVASLANSDDDKVFVLNDESDPNTTLNARFDASTRDYAEMHIASEVSATRTDLTLFFRVRNTVTNTFHLFASASSNLVDSKIWAWVPNSDQFISSAPEQVAFQMSAIPQADLEAADGWSVAIDQMYCVLEP